MTRKERSWKDSAFNYRFGFNGYEREDDIAGTSNVIDFGMRIYDSRLGRFFSTDPIVYPFWSPYQYDGNSPVSQKDVKGMGRGDDVKGDKVKEGEGPLEYGMRNNMIGSNISILDKLAQNNPENFKNYSPTWSVQQKVDYFSDGSGKNWYIDPGQQLTVYKEYGPDPPIDPDPLKDDNSKSTENKNKLGYRENNVDPNGRILRTTGFQLMGAAGALGGSVEFGWASEDESIGRPYVTLEYAYGFDFSFGFVANQHQKVQGADEISLKDLEGNGATKNYSILTLDYSTGGNYDDKSKVGTWEDYGATYKTRTYGASLGSPVGYSYSTGKTWIFFLND